MVVRSIILRQRLKTLFPHTFSIVFSVFVEDIYYLILTILVDHTEPIIHVYKQGQNY